MAPRPSFANAMLRGLDWRAALREPRTWAIVARSMVPVAGVLTLGWSGLQAISVIALDTLAGLWCLVAVAAVVVAREAWARSGDRFSAVIGGIVVFGIVAGLMTFMVVVIAFVLGGSVLARADADPRELLENGWVFWTFGALLAAQVPSFLAVLSRTTGETAKSVLEPRTGFLLRRFVLAGIACSSLAFLWGRVALVGALVVTQIVLAAHEVFGDRFQAVLFPNGVARTSAQPAAAHAGKRRRGRRRDR
jgi:hypothetical protein